MAEVRRDPWRGFGNHDSDFDLGFRNRIVKAEDRLLAEIQIRITSIESIPQTAFTRSPGVHLPTWSSILSTA
jgi:hypothetical protein